MQGAKSDSSGVVQWFAPPARRPVQPRGQTSAKSRQEKESRALDSSYNKDDESKSGLEKPITTADSSNKLSLSKQNSRPTTNTPGNDHLSDVILCKTICTFVDQHLKDLTVHQRLIDEVRFSCNGKFDYQELVKSGLVSQFELSKLRVRDEQTKAIETIRQLTSYLREMTKIKFHCESVLNESENNLDCDEILIMVSEKRTDIIQALNDFVLSNSDIDVPINTVGDINYHEYDLCTDAENHKEPSPTSTVTRIEVAQPSVTGNLSESANFSSLSSTGSKDDVKRFSNSDNLQPLVKLDDELDDISESDRQMELREAEPDKQLLLLEKRRKEMEKLARDTAEFRRLVSDFYTLVKTQGEQLDSIEDNIVIARHNICEGQRNLSKCRKSLTILMPMTGCITGALVGGPLGLVIGSKVGGITMVCAASLVGFISSYGVLRCFVSDKLKDE